MTIDLTPSFLGKRVLICISQRKGEQIGLHKGEPFGELVGRQSWGW